MLNPRLQLLLDSLRKLLRKGNQPYVERLLQRTRSADVALLMRFLDSQERAKVFALLTDEELRAETLSNMDLHLAVELMVTRPVPELVRLLERMSTDDQADLLSELPEALAKELLSTLNPTEAEEVEELLAHDPQTAGGIMSPDFFALPEETTGEEAIRALRTTQDEVEMAFYIYVVNEHEQLVGVVSLRDLVMRAPETPLRDMMEVDVITARPETDQEEVARLAARYDLLAVPVVDESNRLVGIVTIDDVVDVIREEATEDILKMAGADESAFEGGSIFRNVRTRAPWLFATWLGGLSSSFVIGAFEDRLASQVLLAAFIPVVLGMGGNVGTQTATIIVRGLATGRVSLEVGWRFLAREVGVGLALGVIFGILLAAFSWVRYGEVSNVVVLAATVGLSIMASMCNAALLGTVTPLVFARLNIDPAVATGPIVTTAVDVMGILTYFTLASTMLKVFG